MKRYFLGCVAMLSALLGGFPSSAVAEDDDPSLVGTFAEAYHRFERDRIIRNHQKRIKDERRCVGFRDQLEVAGRRHESAATGAFAMDMLQILHEASDQECLRS